MFIITNRHVDASKTGPAILGARPNELGSNELRVVEATRRGRGWSLDVLPDELTAAQKREIGMTSAEGTLYASTYASRKVLQEARKAGKNILVFVHGYNNDITAILNRADHLEKAYGVIVVCFSWPARGGGARGTLSYREDKRDAKASIGGFERFLVIARNHLDDMNEGAKQAAMAKAEKEHPEDNERRDMRFQELMDKACPVKISMMLHSMGNYLLKHTIMSSTSAEIGALFSNIVLVAADTNNIGHPGWVDRLRAREAVYITINEQDRALRASEVKIGDAQRARLGRTRRNLDSIQGIYVDVTDAPSVGRSHAYFEGDAAAPRSALRGFFHRILNGERGEESLPFNAGTGAYKVGTRRRR